MDWNEAIRRAARRQGLTLEGLRLKAALSNGTFYNLLGGRPPRVMRTIDKLRGAGVRIPRSVFTTAL